jgi:redox-sensitive bicupin YhaK (pirin superfamily)
MKTKTAADKVVVGVYRPGSTHMVGDGFPVRNLFPSNELDSEVSPFLLLDYAGPEHFPPTDRPRGVGEHPHRGFETVTIMHQGVVAHRDSAGNAGVIGPGDVQWMTAASGVVHEEMHEREWARRGGTLEAVQLWVNLPKAKKMVAPRYQTLLKRDIPTIALDGGAGSVRVIAGDWEGVPGPARTFTPVRLYDLRLKAGKRASLRLSERHHSSLFLLHGAILIGGTSIVQEAELAVLGARAEGVAVEAEEDATVLVLSGEPIPEPIARYGPFVMNTRDELIQAVHDYQAGAMGRLS